MKNLILFLLLFLQILQVNAQREWYDLNFRTQNSETVFEGTVLAQSSYIESETKNIFTTSTVQVHKIFKGMEKTELVQIITKGGQVEDRFQFLSHGVDLFVGKSSVFFTCPTLHESPNIQIPTKLRICEGDINLNFNHGKASDEWNYYLSIENDIYQKIESTTRRPRLLVSLNPKELINGFNIGDLILLNAKGGGDDKRSEICYDFSNVIFSLQGGIAKVEFDIMVSSNVVGGKYAGSQLVIEYDNAVFGNNIVSSNTIAVTKGEIIEDDNYFVQQNDLTENKYQLEISTPLNQSDMYEISAFPKTLCHFEIKLSNINISNSTGAVFKIDDMQGNSFYYHNSTGVTPYDLVCINSKIDPDRIQFAVNSTLNYFFDNSTYFEDGGEQFYQVDVMASTSQFSNSYNLAFQLEFNDAAFGSNLVSNSAIDVDISNINSSGIYQQSLTDEIAGGAVKIAITNNISPDLINPSDLIGLTSNSIKIATVKIKIVNCSESADLKFTNAPNILIENLEWVGSPNFGAPYTAITYGPQDDLELCPSNGCFTISPNSIPAGNHSVLTINGDNLGTDQGTVFFRSEASFSQTAFTTGENKFDYDPDEDGIINWSNSEAKVRVSSIGPENFICPDIPYSSSTAATGAIKLKKTNGEILNSCGNLHVPYSINNARVERPQNSGNFEAYRVKLINQNGNGGYTIVVAEELEQLLSGSNDEQKISSCVDAAILDWKCLTTVNWERNGFSPLIAQAVDGVNLIHLGNSGDFSNSTQTAVTQFEGNRIDLCFNGNGNPTYFLKEFDISIRRPTDVPPTEPQIVYYVNSLNNDVPTGQMDFYSLITHELGHAHMLRHTFNNDQVMFKILNFSDNKRQLTQGDIDGGNDVMNNLNGFDGVCATNNPLIIQPMIPISPSTDCLNSIDEIRNYNDLISIFPNPTNGNFQIQMDKTLNDKIQQVNIYNSLGQMVYNEIEDRNNFQNSNFAVNLSSRKLSKGIYWLNIQFENYSIVKKIIIQHEK